MLLGHWRQLGIKLKALIVSFLRPFVIIAAAHVPLLFFVFILLLSFLGVFLRCFLRQLVSNFLRESSLSSLVFVV